MDIKFYRYPDTIKNGKIIAAYLGSAFFIIFLIVLTQPYFRKVYSSHDYYLVLLALILGIIGCIFYIGLFADVGIDNDGLLIEFMGKPLRVLWQDITSVKPFGPKILNYWVITTNNKLTPFHRLYGIYSLTSLAPSLCIYKISKSQEDLLTTIRNQIKLTHKAK